MLFRWGAGFGPRTPALSGWQTRKPTATNQQWSLWLYTKHVMDIFPRFWIRRPSTFGKYSIFHPFRGFSANNFTSGNVTLFFHGLKEHRFLGLCVKFLVLWRLFKLFIKLQNWTLVKSLLSNVAHVHYYISYWQNKDNVLR